MEESGKIGMSHQTLVSNTGQSSRVPQYLAAFIATLGGFISGTCLAWTSPVSTKLEGGEYGFPISIDNFAWISSFMPLGGILAAPVVGYLVDAIGRKNTQLVLVIPALLGWACMAWAQSVVMFCAGRFVSGLAGGGFSIVVPLYTNEFSEIAIRGALGCMFQLMLNFGILFVYVVGSFASVFWLTIACGIIPIIYGGLMIFLPESPIYYLQVGRTDQAKKALQWFRGSTYDVDSELTVMKKTIEIMKSESVPILQAFSTKAAKKGLIIGIGVMLFQQLSGVNAVIFFTTTIFADAGASLDPSIETIIVGVVAVVFTYVSTLIVDKMGRRPLLLYSDFVMAICTFLLGFYFFVKQEKFFDSNTISWLPILSVCVFMVAFSLGFGPIPWMFVSEIFPRQISGYACSLCCVFNWLGVFLVTRFFSNINLWIGNFGSFWLFTIISALGTAFVYFIVPETKGKTIEEVQAELEGD